MDTIQTLTEDILGEVGFRLLWEVKEHRADVTVFQRSTCTDGTVFSQLLIPTLFQRLKRQKYTSKDSFNGMGPQNLTWELLLGVDHRGIRNIFIY